MVSLNFLLAALTATAVASATPVLETRDLSSPFVLQTKVVSGDATKDGLFAVAFHSYAGGNDVALLPNTTDAPPSVGAFNGTFVEFNLDPNNPQDTLLWGLFLENLDGDSYWDNWNAAGINAGLGDNSAINNGVTTGFVDTDGILTFVNPVFDFGGWLACDWARQVPQLFWFGSFVDTSNIPSSCAVVDLCIIPA